MKHILLLLFISLALSCSERDMPPQPVAEVPQLPPATQTGAGTIGCLLDGKIFLPGGFNSTNCFYQVVNYKYYFIITFNNRYNKILRQLLLEQKAFK